MGLFRKQQDLISEHADALRGTERELLALRAEVERLTLITQALWELTKQKLAVTDQELLQMIEAVDKLDGKVDGKPTRTAETCPQCARPVSLNTNTCFFCGTQVERKRVF
jgi:hypothetical protein